MNLETHITPQLWKEIQQNYESSRYTEAIKDAMYLLSAVIREKANIEGDGVSLVGQALGGTNPKIKITKLLSQSERDIQSGVEAMLRGLYQAIRNPRSHEKFNDSKEDADSIIIFVNYLFGVINRAKAVFSVADFLVHVFDTGFVRSEQYADALVAEIPAKFRFETFLEAFKRKEEGDSNNLGLFFRSLLKTFSQEQLDSALALISDELRTTSSNASIQATICFLTGDNWAALNPIARMRTEEKIRDSIKSGQFISFASRCADGALATWSRELLPYFGNKDSILQILVQKLGSHEQNSRDYVLQYFAGSLSAIAPVPPPWVVRDLKGKLNSGNEVIYDFLSLQWNENWEKPFAAELANFKAAKQAKQAEEVEDVPF